MMGFFHWDPERAVCVVAASTAHTDGRYGCASPAYLHAATPLALSNVVSANVFG